jgi:hypothetical protein
MVDEREQLSFQRWEQEKAGMIEEYKELEA